ncbi:MAG: DegV family protein [Hespellia sp.]|nr:DegV family protein [Hespellia sp.]
MINVGYGYDREEGVQFQKRFIERLKQEWPQSKAEVGILQIGATIGVHTGPHPLGFGIIKKVLKK